MKSYLNTLMVGMVLGLCLNPLQAATNSITYQGYLEESGSAVTGDYDLVLELYDAETGGNRVGPPWTEQTVPIEDGLFTVVLDLEEALFDGNPRWLEISVRPSGSASAHERLTPRQRVTATPYAIHASNFTGMIGENQLPGNIPRLDDPNLLFPGASRIDDSGLSFDLPDQNGAGLRISGGPRGSGLRFLGATEDRTVSTTPSLTPEAVLVRDDIAYVTSMGSAALSIFDVTDASAPLLLKDIQDGETGFTQMRLPTTVVEYGAHVLVGSPFDLAITVIDVSSPTNPIPVAEMRAGIGGFDPFFSPQSLFIQDTNLFIASNRDDSLNIVDLSIPSNPRLLSTLKDEADDFNDLNAARAVVVTNGIAFVAGQQSLIIIDVSDTSNPAILRSLPDGTNGFNHFEDLRSLFLSGTTLYALAGDFFGDNALSIIDVSDPINPDLLSVVEDGFGEFSHFSLPSDVAVKDGIAYVTVDGDRRFIAIDVTDPFLPKILDQLIDGSNPDARLARPTAVTISGNRAYVTSHRDGVLNILDLSPSTSLVVDDWVGIGKTNPESELDVAGRIKADFLETTGTVSAKAFLGDGSSLTNISRLDAADGDPARVIQVNSFGEVDIGSLFQETDVDIFGFVDVNNHLNADSLSSTNISIRTLNSATRALLEVENGSSGFLAPNRTNTPVTISSRNSALIGFKGRSTSENGFVFQRFTAGDEGSLLFNNTATPGGFQFRTSGDNTRMVIDAQGDVGIGTTSPGTPLDVIGAIRTRGAGNGVIVANPANNSASVTLSWLNNTSRLRIGGSGTGAQNGLDIQTTSDRSLMKLTHAGMVGINTTEPEGELHVKGRTPLGKFIVTPSTSDSDSQVLLTENVTASLGMILRYDGSENRAKFIGLNFDGETADHVTIHRDSGLVGLGRNASANRLEVSGNASKTVAGSWLANSDARIKENIHTVTSALDKLNEVRLVQFRYTDDYKATHPELQDREYLNVIAQEFQEVFPEHVQASGEQLENGEEILQVDIHPLTIYSAAAIQELHDKVQDQASEIERLQSRVRQLENLEQRLTRLESIAAPAEDPSRAEFTKKSP